MYDNSKSENIKQQGKKDICSVWRSTSFVTINYKPIYSSKLSALAKSLWVFGHAHAPDWVFYFSEIATHFKEGKRSLYRAFKELVDVGLAASFPYKIQLPNSKKWVFGGTRHIFFQEYMKAEQIEEVKEELKKCFPCAKFAHAQNEHAQIGTLIDIIDNSNKEEKGDTPLEGGENIPSSPILLSDVPKVSSSDDLPSNKNVDELCEFLFKKIKDKKPNFTGKITPSSRSAAQKLLKLRTKKEIGQAIDFALKDEFWSSICLSVGKILKHLDSIEMQMAKGSSVFSKSPVTQIAENEALAKAVERKFPNEIKKNIISVGNNYIEFVFGMTCDHIKFSENGFKERVLCNLKKLNLPTQDFQ